MVEFFGDDDREPGKMEAEAERPSPKREAKRGRGADRSMNFSYRAEVCIGYKWRALYRELIMPTM